VYRNVSIVCKGFAEASIDLPPGAMAWFRDQGLMDDRIGSFCTTEKVCLARKRTKRIKAGVETQGIQGGHLNI
jgi:hypothetical protein